MFSKFKSKKEEKRYEEVYHGTNDELFEEDLDKIIGGVNIDRTIEEKKFKDDELSLEELDKVTAGIPRVPGFNEELDEGTYINEYGEVVREGRNR